MPCENFTVMPKQKNENREPQIRLDDLTANQQVGGHKDDGADEAPPHALGRSEHVVAIKTANPKDPRQDEQGGVRHFGPDQTEDETD